MTPQEMEDKFNAMGLIVRKVEQWARQQPDKSFIYYGEQGRHYSYAEFNRLANCLANNLRARGLQKGDRVSLFMKNPLVTTIVMYGLWKLGAVFCPVNFLYQGRLLSYQLNDTDPKFLIIESGREPIINDIRDDISCRSVIIHKPREGDHDFSPEQAGLRLDPAFDQVLFADLLEGDGSNPEQGLNFWDTANIVYTSGTTGAPKGVVQSFRWLQNYCYYGVNMLHPDDVTYCDLPMYHVGGAFSLVGRAAWRGSSVAMWDRFSASDFWRRIRVSGATVSLLLDVMMPWLLKAEPRPDDRQNTFRRVHMQPLPDYHHEFAQRFGVDFVNVGYGATESGYVCAAMIDESIDGGGTPQEYLKGYSKEEMYAIAAELDMPVVPGNQPIKKGFMGKATMHQEVAILGEQDQVLPPGQYGQIGLRNRLPYMLLNEYFKKPEATVEAFRNLWFHTGDGAVVDEDGLFYFVDRMGGFIRVKGENISSFQVEDAINAHPGVSVSAAFPVPAAEGLEDDIVVYIVQAEGRSLDEDQVRAWCERQMPRYMQPRHLRFVEALPQTPTHKVEKYKLKQMFLDEGSS